jgi:hypothetical protein
MRGLLAVLPKFLFIIAIALALLLLYTQLIACGTTSCAGYSKLGGGTKAAISLQGSDTQITATIKLSEYSGKEGDIVYVQGSGFTEAYVGFTLGGIGLQIITNCLADASGAFTNCEFEVPAYMGTGTFPFTASTGPTPSGTYTGYASFTISPSGTGGSGSGGGSGGSGSGGSGSGPTPTTPVECNNVCDTSCVFPAAGTCPQSNVQPVQNAQASVQASTPIGSSATCHLCESFLTGPFTATSSALTETAGSASSQISPASDVSNYNADSGNSLWFLTCPLTPETAPTDNSLFYAYTYDNENPNVAGDACLANPPTYLTTNLDLPVTIGIDSSGWVAATVNPLVVAGAGNLQAKDFAYSPELETGGSFVSSSFSVNSYAFQPVPAVAQNDIWTWSSTFATFPGTKVSDVQSANAIPKIQLSYQIQVPCGDAGVGICGLHSPSSYTEEYSCEYTYDYQETTTLQSIYNQQIPFNVVQMNPSNLNPDGSVYGAKFSNFDTPILPYLTFNYIVNSPNAQQLTNSYDIFSPWNYHTPANSIDMLPIDTPSLLFANYSQQNTNDYLISIDQNSLQNNNYLQSALTYFDTQISKSNLNNFWMTTSAGVGATGAKITLLPSSGPVGQGVTVTGSGFTEGATVDISFGGAQVGTCQVSMFTADGSLSSGCTFTVPSWAVVNEKYTVTADDHSGHVGSAIFGVTTGTPIGNGGATITPSPSEGPVGQGVTVSGSGFTQGSSVKIFFNGQQQTTSGTCGISVWSAGGDLLGCIFYVPNYATVGTYTVVAEDGSGISGTAQFTVTAGTPIGNGGATITISPTSGPAGQPVGITGSNFADTFGTAEIYFDSQDTGSSCSVHYNQLTGGCAYDVPSTATAGPHTITVVDTSSGNSDQKTFTVITSTSQAASDSGSAVANQLSESKMRPDMLSPLMAAEPAAADPAAANPSFPGIAGSITNPISIATTPNDYLFVLNQPGGKDTDYYLQVLRMVPRGYYNTSENEPQVAPVTVDTGDAGSGATQFTNEWTDYWDNVVNSQNYTSYVIDSIDLQPFIASYTTYVKTNCGSSQPCGAAQTFVPLNISADSNGDVFIIGNVITSVLPLMRGGWSGVMEIPGASSATPPTPDQILSTTGDWSTNTLAGGAADIPGMLSEVASNPDGTLLYLTGPDANGTVLVLSAASQSLGTSNIGGGATQLTQVNEFNLTFSTLAPGSSSGATLDIAYWLYYGGLYGVPFTGAVSSVTGLQVANVLDSSNCANDHTGCNNADPSQDFDASAYHHPLAIANINGYLYVLDDWQGLFGQWSECDYWWFCAITGSKHSGGVQFNVLLLRVLDSGGANVPINPSQFNDLFTSQGCITTFPCKTGTACSTATAGAGGIAPTAGSCEDTGQDKSYDISCTPSPQCQPIASGCTQPNYGKNPGGPGIQRSCVSQTTTSSVSNSGSRFYGLTTGTYTSTGGYPPYGWILSANVLPNVNSQAATIQVLQNPGFENGMDVSPWTSTGGGSAEEGIAHSGSWAYSMGPNEELTQPGQNAWAGYTVTSITASAWVYLTAQDSVGIGATLGSPGGCISGLESSAFVTGTVGGSGGWYYLSATGPGCSLTSTATTPFDFELVDYPGCTYSGNQCIKPSCPGGDNCGKVYIDDASLTATYTSSSQVASVNFCSSTHYCPYNPVSLAAGKTGTKYNFLPVGPELMVDAILWDAPRQNVGFSLSSNGTVTVLFNKGNPVDTAPFWCVGKFLGIGCSPTSVYNPSYDELLNASFNVENYTKLFDGNIKYTCYTDDPNAVGVPPSVSGCGSLPNLKYVDAPIFFASNPFRYLESLGNTQVETIASSGANEFPASTEYSSSSLSGQVYTNSGPPKLTMQSASVGWGESDGISVQYAGTESDTDKFTLMVCQSGSACTSANSAIDVNGIGGAGYTICSDSTTCLAPGTYTVSWQDTTPNSDGTVASALTTTLTIKDQIFLNYQPAIVQGSSEVITATLPPTNPNDDVQITIEDSGENLIGTNTAVGSAQLSCPSALNQDNICSTCSSTNINYPCPLETGPYTVTATDTSDSALNAPTEKVLVVAPSEGSVPVTPRPQTLQSSINGYAVLPYKYSYTLQQIYSTGGSEAAGVMIGDQQYASDIGVTSCPALSGNFPTTPETMNTVFSYTLIGGHSDMLASTIEAGETYLFYPTSQASQSYYIANLTDTDLILPPQIFYSVQNDRLFGSIWTNVTTCSGSASAGTIDCASNNQVVANAINTLVYNTNIYTQPGCPKSASYCGGFETFSTSPNTGTEYGPQLDAGTADQLKPVIVPKPSLVTVSSEGITVSVMSPVVINTPDAVSAASTNSDSLQIIIGGGVVASGVAPSYTINSNDCAATFSCLYAGIYTIQALDPETGATANVMLSILPGQVGYYYNPLQAVASVPLFDLYKQVLYDMPLETFLNATEYSTSSPTTTYPLRGYQQLVYVMNDRFNNMVYVPVETDLAEPVTINLNVNAQPSPTNPNMTTIMIAGQAGVYSEGGTVFTPLPRTLEGPGGTEQTQYIYLYYNKDLNFAGQGVSPISYPLNAVYCAYGTNGLTADQQPDCGHLSDPVYTTKVDNRLPNVGTVTYAPSYNSMGTCNPPTAGLLVPQYWECNVYGEGFNSICPNTGALQKCDASFPLVASCLSGSDAQTTGNPQAYCAQANGVAAEWPGFTSCIYAQTSGSEQFCEQTDFTVDTSTSGDGLCTSQLGQIPDCPIGSASCTYPSQTQPITAGGGIPIADNEGDFNTVITACGSRLDQITATYYGWPPPEPINVAQVPLAFTANAVNGYGCVGTGNNCASFVTQEETSGNQLELNYNYTPTQTEISVQIGVFELSYGTLGLPALLVSIASAVLLLFWKELLQNGHAEGKRRQK